VNSLVNILIISREAGKLYSLFRSEGFSADAADTGRGEGTQSGDRLYSGRYDMAFLDIDLPGWQQRLLDLRLQFPVVAFSDPDIRTAVEAMKLGATDFLEKPLTGEVLREVIGRHKGQIQDSRDGFGEIIGGSRPMQDVFGLIQRAAASESNVLITGESGTGKELVARAIHRWSPRKEKSFVTLNCSAIPDTLFESELFGFEKGAFTGANFTKKGLIETADGGAVFFDEVGDVSPLFQSKILRVLQEGEIMRIGGGRHIKVDVRIIAATNRDLKGACAKGVFREDLFYRLNVINIHLPPLRERTDDIEPLVRHFIKKHSPKRKDVLIKGISGETLNVLTSHDYPGNVRELENIIERSISFANSPEILPADLPSHMLQCPIVPRTPVPRLKDAILAFERELVRSALEESGGNISKAASILGIYRQQLQRKIKVLKI